MYAWNTSPSSTTTTITPPADSLVKYDSGQLKQELGDGYVGQIRVMVIDDVKGKSIKVMSYHTGQYIIFGM